MPRKNKIPSDKQINKEIEEIQKKEGWGFLPNEYRRWRKKGLKPEEIDYDMCHIFR